MKTVLKKMGIFALFLFIWCFPIINDFKKDILVFMVLYLISISCQLFIQNRIFAFLASTVSIIPLVFFDKAYIFFAVCMRYIAFKYIELFQKQRSNNEGSNIDGFCLSVNINTFLGGIILCYQYFTSDINANKYLIHERESQTIFWCMFLFSLSLASICLSKKVPWKQITGKHHINADFLKKIRYVHIVNVFYFVETLFLFNFVNAQAFKCSGRVIFFPWFVYFSIMMFFNDPILVALLDKAENVSKKIIDKTA